MRLKRRIIAAALCSILMLSQGMISSAQETGMGFSETMGTGAGADFSDIMSDTQSGQPTGDTCILSDIELSFVIPDNAMLKDAEDKYFYYVYVWDGEGIPDIIIGAFDTDTTDGFLDGYTEYMRQARPDLTVAEGETDTVIGDKALKKIVYNYEVSGYTVQDTRYIWAAGTAVYMFTKREIPDIDYTLGNSLEDIIASAQCLSSYAGTNAPQSETSAPQTETSAPQTETSAPQTETSAPQAETEAPADPAGFCVQNEDSSWTVTTDYYIITIPPAWTGHFDAEVLEGEGGGYSLKVVNTESRDAGYGGELFTIMLIPSGEDYTFYPSYDYLGTMMGPEGDYSVVVLYPTDLQTGDVWSEFYKIFNGDKNSALTSITPQKNVVWELPNGNTYNGNDYQTGTDTP